MILNNIAKTILFNPLSKDVNELYIVSGYATPPMLSWYIKNLYHKQPARKPPLVMRMELHDKGLVLSAPEIPGEPSEAARRERGGNRLRG